MGLSLGARSCLVNHVDHELTPHLTLPDATETIADGVAPFREHACIVENSMTMQY
ncbi:MAG: hypothetical protein WCJ41_08625 [Aestuariivirga sp.]|uniref:hypothetical protein n=1 Tax=Aestuariivirga sp. TaxID=2650926 RepID=UPI003016C4EA